MKKIKAIYLMIILFWIPLQAIACDCDIPKITDKFMQSELVARAKIVAIYKNENNSAIYKADIVILDLFKGTSDIKSIYIVGKNDGRLGNSCDIFIPAKTELIIYAQKNVLGQYLTGICSGSVIIQEKLNLREKRKICKEFEILNALKSKNITLNNKIKFKENGTLNNSLKKFQNVKTKKTFALYTITFDKEVNVKTVKTIDGFDLSIDSEILEILKQSKWSSFFDGVKNKIPENTEFLIGIYYYPKEGNYKSFFSVGYY